MCAISAALPTHYERTYTREVNNDGLVVRDPLFCDDGTMVCQVPRPVDGRYTRSVVYSKISGQEMYS